MATPRTLTAPINELLNANNGTKEVEWAEWSEDENEKAGSMDHDYNWFHSYFEKCLRESIRRIFFKISIQSIVCQSVFLSFSNEEEERYSANVFSIYPLEPVDGQGVVNQVLGDGSKSLYERFRQSVQYTAFNSVDSVFLAGSMNRIHEPAINPKTRAFTENRRDLEPKRINPFGNPISFGCIEHSDKAKKREKGNVLRLFVWEECKPWRDIRTRIRSFQ